MIILPKNVWCKYQTKFMYKKICFEPIGGGGGLGAYQRVGPNNFSLKEAYQRGLAYLEKGN